MRRGSAVRRSTAREDPLRYKLGRVFSGGVPPDSIPNSEVKPACGEISAEVARCKDSTMRPFYLWQPNRDADTDPKAS